MIKSKLINRPRIWLMKTSPRFYVCLARLVAKGMFRQERRALAGKLAPAGEGRSVLHFCYNRCGSRYVSSLLQRMLGPQGYQFVDFERYLTHCRPHDLGQLEEVSFLGPRLQARGFHYGPFYSLHRGIPDLSRFKVVLTLRDPRDVLTSRFYSQAYAHTLFEPANIARRERVRAMGVDAFVLEQTGELLERYRAYQQLLDRKEVLFLAYEEMVTDFDRWLGRLAEFLGAAEDRDLLQAIKDEADFSVSREDKFSHRRSVKPGNHRDKLLPETVEELESRLADVLAPFGYADGGSMPARG